MPAKGTFGAPAGLTGQRAEVALVTECSTSYRAALITNTVTSTARSVDDDLDTRAMCRTGTPGSRHSARASSALGARAEILSRHLSGPCPISSRRS